MDFRLGGFSLVRGHILHIIYKILQCLSQSDDKLSVQRYSYGISSTIQYRESYMILYVAIRVCSYSELMLVVAVDRRFILTILLSISYAPNSTVSNTAVTHIEL